MVTDEALIAETVVAKMANHVISMIGFTDLQDQYSDITDKENRSYLS